MDKQNPHGCQNERLLFHGTKPDTCPVIRLESVGHALLHGT